MIHLCYYISSFCVDFHCDNMRQFTSLSGKDQHLGTFCCCCYCSVAKSRPTLCDPIDCSITGFPVFHHLLEFAQTHVNWVNDAIQPSHLLPPSSPPALNCSKHQGLFQWVGSPYQVAKVLELQLQHPVDIQDWFPLRLTGLIPCHPRDSQESSPTPQLKSINSWVLSFLYGPTFPSIHDYWKNHSFVYADLCWQGNVSAF